MSPASRWARPATKWPMPSPEVGGAGGVSTGGGAAALVVVAIQPASSLEMASFIVNKSCFGPFAAAVDAITPVSTATTRASMRSVPNRSK